MINSSFQNNGDFEINMEKLSEKIKQCADSIEEEIEQQRRIQRLARVEAAIFDPSFFNWCDEM